jgi:hypothetical protein
MKMISSINKRYFCSRQGCWNQRTYPLDEALDERRTDGTNGASNEIIAGGRELKPVERLLPGTNTIGKYQVRIIHN